MRILSIARPFTGGYRTDTPAYALAANESAWAKDLIYPNAIAQQRWGWSYDGTTSPTTSSQKIHGVARASFALPNVVRTAGSWYDASTAVKISQHVGNSAANTLLSYASTTEIKYLPRCIYNGEVLWCAQDGVTPLLRWAGSNVPKITVTGNWKMVNGKTVIEGDATGGQIQPNYNALEKGAFIIANFPGAAGVSQNPTYCVRILADKAGSSTIKNYVPIDSLRNYSIGADSAVTTAGFTVSPVATAWPGVPIHQTGSVSRTSSVANTSSVWTAAEAQLNQVYSASAMFNEKMMEDALLVLNNTAGGAHRIGSLTSVTTSTGVMNVSAELDTQTNAAFRIMRRLPFKDAAVHKSTLFGTGVKQYPNRVYVAPPGWNMGLPPGATEPFDPVERCGWSNTTVTGFTDVSDFTLSSYDIPGPYDGDPVVAILASPGPMLVLKRDSVYGMFGGWPTFDVQALSEGSGCIDIRSAVSVNGSCYWAGTEGIFAYRGGTITNLTAGRIEREWRALMAGYVAGTSTVSIGVVSNHVVVCARGLNTAATAGAINGESASAPSSRTYCFHLQTGTWTGTISNFTPYTMWSLQVPGEIDTMLASTEEGATGSRVVDGAPMISGVQVDTSANPRTTQVVAAAPVTDGSSTSFPRMSAWTGTGLAQATGVEGQARFCDVAFHTTFADTTSPTTNMTVTTAHLGSLVNGAVQTKSAGTITATTTLTPIRAKFAVNRTARLHQVRVAVVTLDPTNTKTDIPEVIMSFRDSRRVT